MDRFKGYRKSIDSVCDRARAVVASNESDLPEFSRAIYVGGGGTITCTLVGDSHPVKFINVASGSLLPLRVRRVHSTGTTATNIVSLT